MQQISSTATAQRPMVPMHNAVSFTDMRLLKAISWWWRQSGQVCLPSCFSSPALNTLLTRVFLLLLLLSSSQPRVEPSLYFESPCQCSGHRVIMCVILIISSSPKWTIIGISWPGRTFTSFQRLHCIELLNTSPVATCASLYCNQWFHYQCTIQDAPYIVSLSYVFNHHAYSIMTNSKQETSSLGITNYKVR